MQAALVSVSGNKYVQPVAVMFDRIAKTANSPAWGWGGGDLTDTCAHCGETIPATERSCVLCGQDAGFPNVRRANRPEEVTRLEERFCAAFKAEGMHDILNENTLETGSRQGVNYFGIEGVRLRCGEIGFASLQEPPSDAQNARTCVGRSEGLT
jgi:hypothetical protein